MKIDSYESRFTRGLPDWCFLTVKIRLGDFYLRVFKCPITSADFQKLLRQIFRNYFGRFSETASEDFQKTLQQIVRSTSLAGSCVSSKLLRLSVAHVRSMTVIHFDHEQEPWGTGPVTMARITA